MESQEELNAAVTRTAVMAIFKEMAKLESAADRLFDQLNLTAHEAEFGGGRRVSRWSGANTMFGEPGLRSAVSVIDRVDEAGRVVRVTAEVCYHVSGTVDRSLAFAYHNGTWTYSL